MSFIGKIQNDYEQLWRYIIRPARCPYPEKALGPAIITVEGREVHRKDFMLTNPRGLDFCCSLWVPADVKSCPCVVYLHGNSSNRTEGLEYLRRLLRNNIALCTFDFTGCGNAEGQYISLGFHQQEDLRLVLQYLRIYPQITEIGLWGRSMGAVTAMLYLARQCQVKVAVFDSPFKSFKGLVEDMALKTTKVPKLILSAMLKIISKTIQQRAQFSIYDLNPLKKAAPYIATPAFFIVAVEDEIIPLDHTRLLFDAYAADDKMIKMVHGTHNDVRPKDCVAEAIQFLLKKFGEEREIRVMKREKEEEKREREKEQEVNGEDRKRVEEELKKGEFSWSGIFSIFGKDNKKPNQEHPDPLKSIISSPSSEKQGAESSPSSSPSKKSKKPKSKPSKSQVPFEMGEKQIEETYKNYNYCYM